MGVRLSEDYLGVRVLQTFFVIGPSHRRTGAEFPVTEWSSIQSCLFVAGRGGGLDIITAS